LKALKLASFHFALYIYTRYCNM